MKWVVKNRNRMGTHGDSFDRWKKKKEEEGPPPSSSWGKGGGGQNPPPSPLMDFYNAQTNPWGFVTRATPNTNLNGAWPLTRVRKSMTATWRNMVLMIWPYWRPCMCHLYIRDVGFHESRRRQGATKTDHEDNVRLPKKVTPWSHPPSPGEFDT